MSKWKKIVCALALVLMGGMCGCAAETRGEAPPAASAEADAEQAEADKLLASMSTTEKIGQMVMIGVYGTEINDDMRYLLHQFHYGGIILFDRNLESAEQARDLVQALQQQSEEKVPLFIAIDEEGGLVARGRSFIQAPPSQAELGETGDPEQARLWAAAAAKELRGIGVNVNFAPVADLGAERGRSYSKDPAVAASFLAAAGEGYRENGLMYTLKHFPGIGRAPVDPHKGGSAIEASLKELQEYEFRPFREHIEATDKGRNLDYMIMVGHLAYPALDGDRAATVSKKIVTDLLREDMGYQGLVVTDDLGMGAIASSLTFRQAGIAAIEAGADIVLVCHDYGNAEEAYMGIYDALKSGRLSEERLDESVRRIVLAKLRHCSK